jgi:hypothetical protein
MFHYLPTFAKEFCLCVCYTSGLPDGLFSNQKSQFGKKYRGLRFENVALFYGHLEYFVNILDFFMTIWYILCSFGTFFPVLVSCTKKNLATLLYTSAHINKHRKSLQRGCLSNWAPRLFCRSPKCRKTKCRHFNCRDVDINIFPTLIYPNLTKKYFT